MIRNRHGLQALRHAGQVAILAAAVLPGLAMAGEPSAAQEEQRQREAEESRRQREIAREQATARREMEQRERTQRQALRGQEEAIQRQNDRLEEMRSRLDEASREYARAASELGRNFTYNYGTTVVAAPPRALLGVSVDTSERRDGALVSLVSPGGASEEAGIRAGDLITSIDGHDLTNDSNPGRALVEKLQQVKPDTKVKLAVLRNGRKLNYEVTTRAAPAVAFAGPGVQAELDVLRQRYKDNHPEIISRLNTLRGDSAQNLNFEQFIIGAPLGGMELATISDRLGDYFGVDQGVLVVRAGADAPFGLQDGDVILSIDGRAPTNAQHLGRILRSYQPGEKVKLRVQRDRKAIDLDSSAPAGRGAGTR